MMLALLPISIVRRPADGDVWLRAVLWAICERYRRGEINGSKSGLVERDQGVSGLKSEPVENDPGLRCESEERLRCQRD